MADREGAVPAEARAEPTPDVVRKFGYLLNAFEHASQSDEPAKQDYAAKRRAVLRFVEELAVRPAVPVAPSEPIPDYPMEMQPAGEGVFVGEAPWPEPDLVGEPGTARPTEPSDGAIQAFIAAAAIAIARTPDHHTLSESRPEVTRHALRAAYAVDFVGTATPTNNQIGAAGHLTICAMCGAEWSGEGLHICVTGLPKLASAGTATPPEAAMGDPGRGTFERGVTCWVCPDCAFAFDATHTESTSDTYSCPACFQVAALRLAAPSAGLAAATPTDDREAYWRGRIFSAHYDAGEPLIHGKMGCAQRLIELLDARSASAGLAAAPSQAAYHAALNMMWPEPKEVGDTITGVRPAALLWALNAAYAVDADRPTDSTDLLAAALGVCEEWEKSFKWTPTRAVARLRAAVERHHG